MCVFPEMWNVTHFAALSLSLVFVPVVRPKPLFFCKARRDPPDGPAPRPYRRYAFIRPDGSVDIDVVGTACARLVNDLFEANQKLVNAFRRQMKAQEQYDSFRRQYEGRQAEIRAMEKAVRALQRKARMGEGGPGIGDQIGAAKQAISKKTYQLNELESLFKAREKMLKSANRIAQGLKLIVKERREACEVGIGQVKNADLDMIDQIGRLRLKSEKEQLEMKHRKELLGQMKERKLVIAEELKTTAKHKGKFISTSVWSAGVRQRMETAHLYTHLSSEYNTLKAVVTDLEQMIGECRDRCMRMSSRMNILDAQGRHLKRLRKEIEKCYTRATSRSTVEEMRWQERREAEIEAKMVSDAQERELEEAAAAMTAGSFKSAAEASAATDASEMLMNLTRLKPSLQRSVEEKQWVALDALLNPGYYEHHTSEAEREEMTYDETYQCWQSARVAAPGQLGPLTRDEVLEVMRLPRNPVEAMPFLRTQEQVRAPTRCRVAALSSHLFHPRLLGWGLLMMTRGMLLCCVCCCFCCPG